MDFDKAGYYQMPDVTKDQPFPAGVCGCREFRIPGIITLADGKLFATADARWNDADHDYGGIDTVFAVSGDNGRTWTHGFAAMFPDSDGTPPDPHDATTCIDPCAVTDRNGAIHVFVNMNPTGITTGLGWPCKGSGFAEICGKKRLALTSDYSKTSAEFYKDDTENTLFIGDSKDGFAPVIKSDGTETEYSADPYFNLYRNGVPLYQKQTDTGKMIQQNVFYRDSELHVFNTMYTLHLVTADEGRTWETEIISGSIKRESEDALISSPGNGSLTDGGAMLMPFYTFDNAGYTGVPSIVYSDDNGESWQRTPDFPGTEKFVCTGESKIVVLGENLWRVFMRNQTGYICFADYDKSERRWKNPVRTGVKIHSDCNLSAIPYGNGILVSAPAGTGLESKNRCNGKIWKLPLDCEDGHDPGPGIPVAENAFSYSCMTMAGAEAAVLYDTCGDGEIILRKAEIKD